MPEEQIDIITNQNKPIGQSVDRKEADASADDGDVQILAKKFIERYRSDLEALAKK